jgi:hypothetical protein
MALDEVFGQAWKRKHDNPTIATISAAPRTIYPRSLEELIAICSTRAPIEKFHAAGSHWALSGAAIADTTFIETHDPENFHQAMGKTLYDVVPNCMSDAFIAQLAARKVKPFDADTVSENEGLYPIHIETGKRVYQLYAELDAGDTDSRSLAMLIGDKFGNKDYLGPWAFHTLGGAGGQTVFGALHTGTHGGDIRMPPIADAVMAIHLVADGGRHFWIEPESFLFGIKAPLTDDAKLKAFYGQAQFGGEANFDVTRNDDIFRSVLISAGRFGAVYSIVIAAVRQYSLHQERRLTTWEAIKTQVSDTSSMLYTQMSDADRSRNRFLQIAISVTPHDNFTKHHAGVTKCRNVPMAVIPGTIVPAGRPERVGAMVEAFNSMTQAPRFEFAGNSHTYNPDPAHPGTAKPASFLENACSDANFVNGVLKQVIKEIEDFVSSNGEIIGPALGTAAATGGGGLLPFLAPFLAILAILASLLAALERASSPRFGQVMDDVRKALLDNPDPIQRMAGLLVWQMIASEVFSDQQKDSDYEAISYAVMDGHDYFDRSCNVNVQSIEVFFDATDPMLIAFVDALLAFEIGQEVTLGHAFVGYISMRFTGQTRALLGPQKFPLSCAVEVAGLADVAGTKELIDFASTLALDNNFKGILHWGQHNESTRAHIQERFGDPAVDPGSPMARWRNALKFITDNGNLDGYSSAFTRRTGLEEF